MGRLGHVGQVALDDLDQRDQRVEPADPLGGGRERRTAQQAGDAVAARLALLRPHQADRPHARQVGEQPLQHGLADEAGDAGQQDAPSVEPCPAAARDALLSRSTHLPTACRHRRSSNHEHG
ncbi:hypothetical protein GCM10025868_25930 [Angustibacter aerolatus]|uniref:Uncharacterized protein n=1 Tax=Angustibacter aerolatus TaxID=1162965 RepID=A0ABQ6JGM9_9ACTN|nr:hypothetical protein GCM10025868_25930 [Angustibacter aerolatus]